jgi:hypothetical protein
MAGPKGSSMLSFLWNLHTDFNSDCTNLYSHQKSIRIPFPSHPCQHLLLYVFLMVAILTDVRWNLSVTSIYISFMAKDIEHFFMCLLTIYTYYYENHLTHFPIY